VTPSPPPPSQRDHDAERRARVRVMEAMGELEDSARESEQLLLSSQRECSGLQLQLHTLTSGHKEMQERVAASGCEVKRLVEEVQQEQERRRVSDEGVRAQLLHAARRLSRVTCRVSRVAVAGLAAALAATHTMKEEIRGLKAQLSASEATAAAAASASSAAGGASDDKSSGEGGLVQQKEYIRKLKAVLKERESELQQVTAQLKETRGQEAQFLAEVQLLQARIKKLSSSSVSRCVHVRVCLRARSFVLAHDNV